jgi:hypothetical protein
MGSSSDQTGLERGQVFVHPNHPWDHVPTICAGMTIVTPFPLRLRPRAPLSPLCDVEKGRGRTHGGHESPVRDGPAWPTGDGGRRARRGGAGQIRGLPPYGASGAQRTRTLFARNQVVVETALAQWLHLSAAKGRSSERHCGQVLVSVGGPKTVLPRLFMYARYGTTRTK